MLELTSPGYIHEWIILLLSLRHGSKSLLTDRHFVPCRAFCLKRKKNSPDTVMTTANRASRYRVVHLQFVKMNANSSLHSSSSDPEASSAAVPTYILYTYAFVEITKPTAQPMQATTIHWNILYGAFCV